MIGGGVGGTAVLYWLARLGWNDVVLCERAELTSGSTFHSAGLVGQLRGSLSLTKMMMSSVELYRTLAAEVELETGWHEVGSLRLASSEERMEELSRQAGWAKTLVSRSSCVGRGGTGALPPMSAEGVLGAAYLPTDGYIDPRQLSSRSPKARAEAARSLHEHACDRDPGRRGKVSARETDDGVIETQIVVNAGGMYAGEIVDWPGQRSVDPDGARLPDHEAEAASRSTCRRCATRRFSSTSAASPADC